MATFVSGNYAVENAFKRFNAAVIKQFGESAKTLPSPADMLLQKVESIPVEQINESTAQWTHQTGKPPMKLVKSENRWKIDLRQMDAAPDKTVFEAFADTADVFNKLTDRISRGEFKTEAEVRRALGGR